MQELIASLHAEYARLWPGLPEANARLYAAQCALVQAQAALNEAKKALKALNSSDADYFLGCIRGLEEAARGSSTVPR